MDLPGQEGYPPRDASNFPAPRDAPSEDDGSSEGRLDLRASAFDRPAPDIVGPVGEIGGWALDAKEVPDLSEAQLAEMGRQVAEVCPIEGWRRADAEGREAMARASHDVIREGWALPWTPLDLDQKLDGKRFGQFDPSTGEVAVNRDLLATEEPQDLLDTIVHENRHAVQAAQIAEYRAGSRRTGVDWEKVDHWGTAWETYRGLPRMQYVDHPLETDAERTAAGVAKGYLRAQIPIRGEERGR